ncbi:acyl-CoA dehydrogenase family protein [Rhodococcus tibetensis]|uniref:Acyl-CoA/acyl-ACP dehydrogenase n=1 Tax=Rhodococcus tibetensis TaxID=2965064 RepID=A0ABT1Q9K2_9NOCA|nr:acyl-CoA dehydrogenase family protein [Rhodococcus sp. FXJ9.536]MCQ4118931.1 acyl-CoA/acyl-ACP dehydrogenase [Rhodococcus sp. FXJ9.536]
MSAATYQRAEAAHTIWPTREPLLENMFPELFEYLSGTPLLTLETRGSGVVERFKTSGAIGLIVPQELGGVGASARTAIAVQREIGGRSPSLAAATTMHHLSLATLLEYAHAGTEDDLDLARAIVGANTLIASGFAEGKSGSSVFEPSMKAEQVTGGYLVSGSKKPCSMSSSMDLLTATVVVPSENGPLRGIALISAETPGLSVRPFWKTHVLGGSESDEVVLDEVFVPEQLVIADTDGQSMHRHEMTGFLWFGMLITASYLGAASRLVELLMAKPNANSDLIVSAAGELEMSYSAVESIARRFDGGERGADLSAQLLLVRYATRDSLTRSAASSVAGLGGSAFIDKPEVAYLESVVHAYGFHPPFRSQMAAGIVEYLEGGLFMLTPDSSERSSAASGGSR